MANKMLIDASHPEETRVVVVRGSRVEEFDFESANKKQLRGNIYLAKVTRVEPSLQAAFVEYGGNRHGFLAFNEIHPDYYQIPVADRQALIAEDARAERDAEDEENGGRRRRRRGRDRDRPARRQDGETISSAPIDEEAAPAAEAAADGDAPAEAAQEQPEGEDSGSDVREDAETAEAGAEETREPRERARVARPKPGEADDEGGGGITEIVRDEEEEIVEQLGSGDALEEVPDRPRHSRRQYKIQEVIKRRQILLVQVVKEERGNKGAALTTYLSLAGRYSVLMPNTGRGGGISRKITNAADRKRLKTVAQDLEVPEGMGVILRTAGASRTKAEIKRDFEYLLRLWENVRELTLQSTAPALVYEEGSLVKRAIRDLYNKDIDEILVSGDGAYRDAKDFMRMLMPSHAKNVQPYRETQPIFAKYGVEAQLDAMFSNQVTLKSGGYIVINQTEALVAIDVNSGRATREHNIEDTALKTNLEAADEVARQLRLRDLAGLIVIDFIDMEEKRNNRSVERRLKDALKNDRARIQVGRISPFGLLEMSRQRIRTGVLEGSTVPCPHCAGAGIVRATPSIALHVLRAVEEMLLKGATHHLIVRTRTEVALYILNQKRSHLRALEDRFGVNVTILADDSHTGTHAFAIERGEAIEGAPRVVPAIIQVDSVAMPEPQDEDVAEEAEDEDEEAEAEPRGREGRDAQGRDDARADGEGGRRRRRRRRRRGGRGGEGREGLPGGQPMPLDAPQPDVEAAPFAGEVTIEPGTSLEEAVAEDIRASAEGDGDRNGRRRSRRGRGRGRRPAEGEAGAAETAEESEAAEAVAQEAPEPRSAEPAPPEPEPARAEASPAPAAERPAPPPAPEPEPEPAATIDYSVTTEPVVVGTEAEANRPKRGGWWARAKASLGGG
jgi:ribonuclease E